MKKLLGVWAVAFVLGFAGFETQAQLLTGTNLDLTFNKTGFATDLNVQDNTNPGNGATRLKIWNNVAGGSSFYCQAFGSSSTGVTANAAGIGAATGSKFLLFAGAGLPIMLTANGQSTDLQGHIFISTAGNVGIHNSSPTEALTVDGNIRAVGIGAGGTRGSGTISSSIVEIRGANADLAEGFEVLNAEESVLPGMVVSLSEKSPGAVELSNTSYDRKVAGVISGAGDLHAGIQLGHADEVNSGKLSPIALTGRVWCYVDASYGAVSVGDLLTTSPTQGHAMRASDFTQTQGAVLGKAMSALPSGRGLVLVLISLQ